MVFTQDDGRKELVFEAGDTLKLTTDDAFKEKCTKEVVWLDYKNITKVELAQIVQNFTILYLVKYFILH